jgi:hypothetical protein
LLATVVNFTCPVARSPGNKAIRTINVERRLLTITGDLDDPIGLSGFIFPIANINFPV